ncbi:solute carrier family 45 member 3-like [Protopterus annectens]|uniref:solute carrier family 45 member 3-like n=1 Tax=Protopterus annectens TaxID=7888 RepID=UPI001CFA5BF7|nr:solute carrier family 45 member 3-like [Protopterus annectens]XP_043943500.1 solute carrier family 45 member 3-like [Protopterus annectens]
MMCNLQWHLFMLNSITCGLEICVAAGITYVPPLLLEAGVKEQYMTMVLGIGPVLGLIFIPLIGSASDNCTSNYGRRLPFVWFLSLGVLLSLFIIPHADVMATYFSFGGQTLQITFLIIGVVLLDFCVQVCFTPLEALLSDLYHDAEDYGQAFAIFSFMISLGGCIGYLLTAVNWDNGCFLQYLGNQEDCLFMLLAVIFVASVLITMKASWELCPPSRHTVHSKTFETAGSITRCHYCCFGSKCRFWSLKSGSVFCLLRTCWAMLPALYHSYCHVPRVMKQLCLAQLCSWMAVMSFILFYTDFVGEGLYEGIPSAAPGTASRIRYDEGIRMGSLGLFLQCATSTIFSIIINKLVRSFGSGKVYLVSMVTFTFSASVICLSKNVALVTAMSSLTGFAYAMLQTLPYTLTCLYHKEKEVFMPKKLPSITYHSEPTVTRESVCLALSQQLSDVEASPKYSHANQNGLIPCKDKTVFYPDGYSCSRDLQLVPNDFHPYVNVNQSFISAGENYEQRGIGLDFAILDSTFLLSQVFPSLFMGIVVQLSESVTAYIASAVIFGLISIYLATGIVFDKQDVGSKTCYQIF